MAGFQFSVPHLHPVISSHFRCLVCLLAAALVARAEVVASSSLWWCPQSGRTCCRKMNHIKSLVFGKGNSVLKTKDNFTYFRHDRVPFILLFP